LNEELNVKAALWTAVFFGVAGAGVGRADFTVQSETFRCEVLPRTNTKTWEPRGSVDAKIEGRTLVLAFGPNGRGSALDQLATTNTDFENRVEARCEGSVTLRAENHFKIRDFNFIRNTADISPDNGKIELKVVGMASVDGTNQKDSFEKVWTMFYRDLTNLDGAFSAKTESNTVCGSQLTLHFKDLRGIVSTDQNSGSLTEVSLQALKLNLDDC
jgi:hypothetical protein